jgi:hypothetical protein
MPGFFTRRYTDAPCLDVGWALPTAAEPGYTPLVDCGAINAYAHAARLTYPTNAPTSTQGGLAANAPVNGHAPIVSAA